MIELSILKDRAFLLNAVRSFFAKKGVLEVDCCALVPHPSLDSHIEVMKVELADTEKGYLHTSPEYGMKRLLVEGSSDIFYLGHVFRKGEISPRHQPEFTMIEWYRVGMDFEQFIQEACELISLALGPLSARHLTYREAFFSFTSLDPFEAPLEALQRLAARFASISASWSRDDLLHLILSHAIEPHLGKGELLVLLDYPPSQAALSRLTQKDRQLVAKRFEVYFEGVELCNGYHELSDPLEQLERFEEENKARQSQGKKAHSIDTAFIEALHHGLPDCCGASIGFDRLMLLRHKKTSLEEVLPLAWKKLQKKIPVE